MLVVVDVLEVGFLVELEVEPEVEPPDPAVEPPVEPDPVVVVVVEPSVVTSATDVEPVVDSVPLEAVVVVLSVCAPSDAPQAVNARSEKTNKIASNFFIVFTPQYRFVRYLR